MAFLAGLGAHDMHHEESHFGWREKLSCALPRAFREFPQQIFVSAAAGARQGCDV